MMRGTRSYPDESADPFPRPPTTFEDGDGRSITIEPIGEPRTGAEGEATDAAVEALTEMYLQFDPEDRAQGIPPTGEGPIRDWLGPIVGNGLNVGAREADGDGYVGHATLVPDTDDPAAVEDLGSIEWELAIFVLQEYQRAGIGTVMLEHLLGHAGDLGVERVWLTVERWNSPAIALYERVGFEISSTESFDREMSIRLSGGDSESE